MAKSNNYHVSGNRSDGYSVKRAGASRASGRFTTKSEAERVAKQLVRNLGGGEVRIHAPNGRIADSDTISKGNDPFPPRDKVK